MPITGTWKDRKAIQAGANKWGNGWNPIHAIPTGFGRSDTPPNLVYDGIEPSGLLDPALIDQYSPESMGYCDEDTANALYGYGVQNGTAERPPVGTDPNRASTNGFPPPIPSNSGVPSGTAIRSKDVGAEVGSTPKQEPTEDVAQGWLNKPVGEVEDSTVSDPSQYEMQTSMTQRDKIRAGSQMPTGRANEYDAPIPSRRPTWGQRLKYWSGEQRHYDMTPRVQDEIIRPWWSRNAGTGYQEWLAPNEMYQSEPMQRTSPPDPYQGPDAPIAGGSLPEHTWSDEDVIPYV